MALITESIIKNIEAKIANAQGKLDSLNKDKADATATREGKQEEILDNTKQSREMIKRLTEEDNAYIVEYGKHWENFLALNSDRAEIVMGKKYNNNDAWTAFAGDFIQESMQPYDMEDDDWSKYMEEWRASNEPDNKAYREDWERDLAEDHDKAMVAIDEFKENLTGDNGVFEQENNKLEKDVADSEDAKKTADTTRKQEVEKLENMQDKLGQNEADLAALEPKLNEAKTKLAAAPDGSEEKIELQKEVDDMQASFDSYTAEIKDLTDKVATQKPITEAAEKALTAADAALTAAREKLKDHKQADAEVRQMFDWTREEYSDLATDNKQFMIFSGIVMIGTRPLMDYIEEGKASNLIVIRENEQRARQEIGETSIKDKRREKIILEFKPDDDKETNDFHKDTAIVRSALMETLGVTDENETKIRQIIKEYEDEEFTAEKALELTRASMFDLKDSGIIDKIKSACAKGLTSVTFDEKEISGTEILGLIWKNFKITHNSRPAPGPNRQLTRIDTKVTVEWGIVNQN